MLEHLFSLFPFFSSSQTRLTSKTSASDETTTKPKPMEFLDLPPNIMKIILSKLDMKDIINLATISKESKKVVQNYSEDKEVRAVIIVEPQFLLFILTYIGNFFVLSELGECFNVKTPLTSLPSVMLNFNGTHLPVFYPEKQPRTRNFHHAYLESPETTLTLLLSFAKEVFQFETVNLCIEDDSGDEDVLKVYNILGNILKIPVKHCQMRERYRSLNTTPLVLGGLAGNRPR